ncbi:type II secretion system F family protein [Dickeya chrysanthemi]|uniref:type II secretion system F family protein n=1 Tax=Dickeya chrysanthemi TaxID=556 RepID=UPI0003A5EE40|nr:type II secretion system F family protein [Dickeya chrysanthemi]MBX9447283.1 type II secretion system F family protein [Dickeya chrysanthemi]
MTPFMLNLITALVFGVALLTLLAIAYWRRQRQLARLRTQRMAQIFGEDAATATTQVDSILKSHAYTPFAGVPVLGRLAAVWWQQLEFIGWQQTLRKRVMMLFAICLVVGMAIGRRTPMPLTSGLLFSFALTVAIGAVMFHNTLQKHLHQLRESLPDAIDAITRSCRAGVPVANTFGQVAAHLSGPLANEFRLIDHWLKLGVPLRQVIQTSAGRVPMAEYRFFVVILIINQEAGGRLGETLERLSATLRQRRELALKVQSKTSEARASAKIVAALFPGCLGYMYLKSPEDFDFLFNDPVGSTVLVYALCSVTLGIVITHLMVKRIA